MLQALYSRDSSSITDAAKRAKLDRSGDFMKRFYIGYSHNSIGDLANVLLCVENVSLFSAKAIQHDPLYNGQETSTRYIDFSKQPRWLTDSDTEQGVSRSILQGDLLEFYTSGLPLQMEHMAALFKLNLSDPVETRAARAASLDVLRGYLPVGMGTNLSWVTTVRQLNDRLSTLRAWGLPDLEEAADLIEELFQENFPNSFKLREARPISNPTVIDGAEGLLTFDRSDLWAELSGVTSSFLLDFGSWRDVARHRSVRQSIFFPTVNYGTSAFYTELLHPGLSSKGDELLKRTAETLRPDEMSYAIPMAFQVPVVLHGHLDKFRYIIKLRTKQDVHPTLRRAMQGLGEGLNGIIQQLKDTEGVTDTPKVEYTREPDWIVNGKRGQQTITLKRREPPVHVVGFEPPTV